jgi:hypothetical protein
MMNYRSLFFTILVLFLASLSAIAQEKQEAVTALKPVAFSVKPSQGYTFRLINPCYPFHGNKNAIVRIAPELAELTGARSTDGANTVQLKFAASVNVLIALPQGQQLNTTNAQLIMDSALTITGLPPYNIYKVAYKKGWQTVTYQSKDGFVAGVIGASQQLSNQSAHLPDGRLWRPYITDGLTDSLRLFEIMGGPDQPVIDKGMPGTEGIQGGFEGGTCVKVGNTYHMFPTERAGEPGVEAYYDRVKTRIGHWESTDAIHWKRVATIYQASGKYAIAEEDNPMNDRRGAIWSYNAVFNEKEDRWYGYYLTYTVDRNIQPNHSFGRIWCTKSKTKGIEGIGGPYDEGQLIMEPGLDGQPWEGRQGVASFYPFPVKDGWLGFYAGAYPFKTWADYPKNTGTGWFIGLARSASMDGPWKRLDTTVNPVKSINPEFVENPLVYKLQNGVYITLFDGGPDDGAHHFPNMIGYSLSKDGLHWSEARYLPFQIKVKRWWSTMRTPLCLIPEGDNVYTIVYAAYNQPNKRFHPMGMVKVKMEPKMLEELLKGL